VTLHRAIAAALLLAGAATAQAAPVCSAISLGTSANATGSITPTIGTHATGDLLLYVSAARTNTETSDTDPSGYTLISAGPDNAVEVWGKIATSGSETAPAISWNGSSRGIASIIVLRSTTGWPAIASILSASNAGTASQTFMRYRSLRISNDDKCAIQIGYKNTTTGTTNVATAVGVTSGWTTLGFHNDGQNAGFLFGAQFQSQTTATNATQNDETVTGNSDSATSRGLTLALNMNAEAGGELTGAPTVTALDSDSYTVSGETDDSVLISAVACAQNSTAPSIGQVEAGDCTGDVDALAAATDTWNGSDSLTLGGSLTRLVYDVYVTDGTTLYTSADEALECAAGKQCVTLTSIEADTWVDSYNDIADTDIAVSDTVEIDTETNPDSFAWTQGADGSGEYTGDSTWQYLCIRVQDATAGDYLAWTGSGVCGANYLSLNFNNHDPTPPEEAPDYAWLIDEAMSVDLCALFADEDAGQTLTGTHSSTGTGTGADKHSAGTSFGGDGDCTLSGTPDTEGSGSFTFTVTDDAGGDAETAVTWAVFDLVQVPDCATANLDLGACLTLLEAETLSGEVAGMIYSDTVPAGSVISQDPAAASEVAPFSIVDLVLSRGAKSATKWQRLRKLRPPNGMRIWH
jgi:hypothetical protein